MKNIENLVMKMMDDINYGWIDRDSEKHQYVDDDFMSNYILQSPEELLSSKMGVCWDQVELERYLFLENDVKVMTYFIVHYDGANCPTHTFLTFEKDDMVYWFEHSWEKFRGIHPYKSLKQLLADVKNKFIEVELNNKYQENSLYLYEYNQPNYHISVDDFYKHCDSGKLIKIDELR